MTISATVEINLQRLVTQQRAIQEGTREGLVIVGQHIVNLASQLAPKDTTDLSQSGEHHLEGNILVVSFGNGLPDDRAVAQEFGTIYMPAQPYLTVAVKEIDIVDEMARVIRSKLV